MITHVAIRFQGKIWSLPKPYRHHHVIRAIAEELKLKHVDAYRDDQGFLDNKGNYLTRELALLHAMRCGQFTRKTGNLQILFSEDVW